MEELTPEITSRIKLLQEKFKNSGQDMKSYLDGLLHDRYLTYWDYIHLDTLLSLQDTRTGIPDEMIFITYHQITELYFKLIIHEQLQIIENDTLDAAFFTSKLDRITRYFENLIHSFTIMIKGMDRGQFVKFRMSLLPASGFQSAQFRMIEIYATDVRNLLHPSARGEARFRESENPTLEELHDNTYWKRGATDSDTKEKTLTLKQFEERYTFRFLRIAGQVKSSNIYQKYLNLPEEQKQDEKLLEAMKLFDQQVNINWKLMHLGAAMRHLVPKRGESVEATGGTNWRKYLPPHFQFMSFFPGIWTEQEKSDWGKQWVTHKFNTEA